MARTSWNWNGPGPITQHWKRKNNPVSGNFHSHRKGQLTNSRQSDVNAVLLRNTRANGNRPCNSEPRLRDDNPSP
ncbi:hypothetical protein TNCV_40301 [Trichonephila clavipes]|nr:hypothetical protein TNCV_40301 [Trichonephila clavipes]